VSIAGRLVRSQSRPRHGKEKKRERNIFHLVEIEL
jgi:hypothetical protein